MDSLILGTICNLSVWREHKEYNFNYSDSQLSKAWRHSKQNLQ